MSCMITKNYELRLPSATFWIICSCEDKQSNFCEKYQNPVAGRMIKSFLTDRVAFSLSIPSRSRSPPTFTLTLTLHPDPYPYPYPYPHPWCYPYPRFTNAANLEQRALYSTASDPQSQMIPKMDRKWSSTASDPQSWPQMIPKEK